MVVCARCKKEMQCIKTGMTVRFNDNGEHAFAGDMLECPVCKATIAVTNANSYYDEGAKRATPFDVWMNADKGFTPKSFECGSLGEDEAWGEWFRCPKCDNTLIHEGAKYCSMCGVPVKPTHQEQTYTEDDVYRNMK